MAASGLGQGFKDNLIGLSGEGPTIGIQKCFPNPLGIVSRLAIDQALDDEQEGVYAAAF